MVPQAIESLEEPWSPISWRDAAQRKRRWQCQHLAYVLIFTSSYMCQPFCCSSDMVSFICSVCDYAAPVHKFWRRLKSFLFSGLSVFSKLKNYKETIASEWNSLKIFFIRMFHETSIKESFLPNICIYICAQTFSQKHTYKNSYTTVIKSIYSDVHSTRSFV